MRIARQIGMESYTVDYAGVWLRFAALAIDGAILGVVIWLFNGVWSLAFGLGWMGGSGNEELSYGEVGAIFWVLGLLLPFLMIAAYFICFWAWRSQTLGLMALRLRVVRFDGGRIGWSGATMRFLGYIIAVVPFFIGFFMVALDSRRQGLHDKIAETFVVRGT
jgi:uncharacterized RDD family membrane protein YckC